MKFKLKPLILKVVKLLEKEGFYIQRMRGDHIIVNKNPSLRRPIVLVNVKTPSNIVRLNLIEALKEAGADEKIVLEINELLRY